MFGHFDTEISYEFITVVDSAKDRHIQKIRHHIKFNQRLELFCSLHCFDGLSEQQNLSSDVGR